MSEVLQLLAEARIPIRDHGDNVGQGFVNICCPFCGEPRFHLGINLEEHWFKCLMCGQGGPWYSLARLLQQRYPQVNWFSLRGPYDRPRYLDEQSVSPVMKQRIKRLTRPFDSYEEISKRDQAAWNYLVKVRELAPDVIKETGVSVGRGEMRGCVAFVDGEFLAARRYRGFGPTWLKRGSAEAPYGATWVARVHPLWVVICEGVFDVLSVPLGHALGMLGITSGVKWIDTAVSLLPETEAIVMGLDRGVSTRTISTISLLFLDEGYGVYVWDWSDPLFDGIKDLDEVRLRYGEEWLHDRLLSLIGQGAKRSEALVDLL